jgi:glycosyltransferase involved in cell wall biosynthesis
VRIALVHDWLTGMRGGEKVLLELVRLLPQADIFTLLWRRGSVAREIEERVRGTSWLQGLPSRTYRYYLPLFPAAVRSLDLAAYDLVIASSHAVAHAARARRRIAYIPTPMRYLWDARAEYFRFGRGAWWKRAALAAVAPWLRRFDRRAAAGVDHLVANSWHVRERIRRVWGRDAAVIYPPVDTDFFTPEGEPEDYYLAVDAFAEGRRRLLVAGKGTVEAELRARARPPVEFLREVSDEALRQHSARFSRPVFHARMKEFLDEHGC